MTRFIRSYFLLGIIFFVGLFLRVVSLSSVPAGFHIDEASLGYNAYSLLLTGKDDNGNFLPLYIDMFGDFRPAGYHYLAIVPVALLGLTEFATRLPGALFGAVTIFAFFFFALVLLKDKTVAFVSALFLAISPWHLTFSRASAEAIVALFFILTGFGLVIKSTQSRKSLHLAVGTILLCVSFFFYHTPRVFVPLLFAVFIGYFFITSFKELGKSYISKLLVAFGFLCIVVFSLVFVVSGGTGRFSQVNIFTWPETKLVIEEQVREDGIAKTPPIVARLLHNKLVNYPITFLGNYFSYFTGDFLFIKGGLPIWYVVPHMGLMYVVLLPVLLYGLVKLSQNKSVYAKIPLLWMIVAPVTAAITVDDIPNINRTMVLLPMLELSAAYGLVMFFRSVKRQQRIIFAGVFSLLSVVNIVYFSHQYFVQSTVHRTWYRNNGFKEMMQVVQSAPNIEKIFITKATGGVYPLVLFYSRFDPKEYQRLGSTRNDDYTGFGKFTFVPQSCNWKDRDDRFPTYTSAIFVNRGDCDWTKFRKLLKKEKIIYKEDGTAAFSLVYEE